MGIRWSLLLVVLPIPVGQWPDGFPGAVWLSVGILVVYLGIIVLAWWKLGPLQFDKPLMRMWPTELDSEPGENSSTGR